MGNLTVQTTGIFSGFQNNTDINTALGNLGTMSAGATAPTTASTGLSSLAGLWWHDTSNNILKLRDQADTTWISVATVDETNKIVYGMAVRPNLVTGGSKTYDATDRGAFTIRSNSGLAMSDTVPVTEGYNTVIVNQDASASLVVTPASGTVDGVASLTVSPGQSVQYVANGSNGFTSRGASSSGSAGGYINKFRNGAMDVWQRGTSGGSISGGGEVYTVDGWKVGPTGAAVSWTQASGRAATRFALQLTGNTSMTATRVIQFIESFLSAGLAGQRVMLQAQVFNNTGGAITPKLTIKHAGSVDNWSSPTTDVNAVSLQSCANNAWTQVSYSFTADASSGNGLLAFIDFQSALNSNSKSVKITELDIRVAPSVQPPELRAVAAELALCQRYFFGITAGGAGVPIGTGMFINVTSCCSGFIGSNWAGGLPLPVSMRVAPTGISFSGGGLFNWSPSFGAARPDFVGLTATWPFPTAPPVADSVLKTLGAAFFYVTGAEL